MHLFEKVELVRKAEARGECDAAEAQDEIDRLYRVNAETRERNWQRLLEADRNGGGFRVFDPRKS